MSQLRKVLIIVSILLYSVTALADKLILASTTSLDNSGLYTYLLPYFYDETGINVSVISVGTGRAMAIARQGDTDLLIVHDRESELEFMEQGFGIECTSFMYNQYLIVGPHTNPAKINQSMDITDVMQAIAKSHSVFVSRGDNSGTYKKEMNLWKQANIIPHSKLSWYYEVGRGMSVVLNVANEKLGYTLTDYATWLSFNNRTNLTILYDNKKYMYNPYSIILVNPQRHPRVNIQLAKRFAEWIKGDTALQLIERYQVKGHQVYFPLRGKEQQSCA